MKTLVLTASLFIASCSTIQEATFDRSLVYLPTGETTITVRDLVALYSRVKEVHRSNLNSFSEVELRTFEKGDEILSSFYVKVLNLRPCVLDKTHYCPSLSKVKKELEPVFEVVDTMITIYDSKPISSDQAYIDAKLQYQLTAEEIKSYLDESPLYTGKGRSVLDYLDAIYPILRTILSLYLV